MNKQAYSLMLKSNKIAIFTHANPDFDGVASSVALKLHLDSLGKKVQLFCEDKVPQYINFIPHSNEYINSCDNIEDFDLAIVLDCVNLSRLGKIAELASKIENRIVIDHHEEFTPYGIINISNPNASATGEMLYTFFKENNLEISKDIASCLYAAIASDTGGFIQSNVNNQTFLIVNELINLEINYSDLNNKLFYQKSKTQFHLLKEFINNVKFEFDEKFVYCVLTQDIFNKCNASIEDTEGLSEHIRNINTVNVSILISEKKPNIFLLSIRSRNNYSACRIAKCFGGGGHYNAAGCRIVGNIDKILPKILNAVKKELNNEWNN